MCEKREEVQEPNPYLRRDHNDSQCGGAVRCAGTPFFLFFYSCRRHHHRHHHHHHFIEPSYPKPAILRARLHTLHVAQAENNTLTPHATLQGGKNLKNIPEQVTETHQGEGKTLGVNDRPVFPKPPSLLPFPAGENARIG